MDVLTKFLNSISYKFPKGYPEMDNNQDVLILETELKKLGFNLYENEFNALTFHDLKKHTDGHRFLNLIKKIEEKLPFSIIGGESTPLKFITPEYSEAFKTLDPQEIKKLATGPINSFPFFIDDMGKKYSISNLLKDTYFGGRGKGSSTIVEDYNLQLLNSQILKLVEENGGPIDIKVGGDIYKNIIKAETQPGTPKSDFNLINSENTPVAFISHKKAGGKGADAGDFIRWSGYTMYKDHPEVKEFNQALNQWVEENNPERGLPPSTRFISKVKDGELIRKLIYGPKYGEGFSKDNVNIISQGKITLKPIENNTFKLISEYELIPPQLPIGEYAPYFSSAYRGDRNMFDIKNNEAIVMTRSTVMRSSSIYELEGGKFKKIK